MVVLFLWFGHDATAEERVDLVVGMGLVGGGHVQLVPQLQQLPITYIKVTFPFNCFFLLFLYNMYRITSTKIFEHFYISC